MFGIMARSALQTWTGGDEKKQSTLLMPWSEQPLRWWSIHSSIHPSRLQRRFDLSHDSLLDRIWKAQMRSDSMVVRDSVFLDEESDYCCMFRLCIFIFLACMSNFLWARIERGLVWRPVIVFSGHRCYRWCGIIQHESFQHFCHSCLAWLVCERTHTYDVCVLSKEWGTAVLPWVELLSWSCFFQMVICKYHSLLCSSIERSIDWFSFLFIREISRRSDCMQYWFLTHCEIGWEEV